MNDIRLMGLSRPTYIRSPQSALATLRNERVLTQCNVRLRARDAQNTHRIDALRYPRVNIWSRFFLLGESDMRNARSRGRLRDRLKMVNFDLLELS